MELQDGETTVRRFKDFPRVTVEQMKEMFASRSAPRRIDELGAWGTPTYLIVDSKAQVLRENLDRGTVSAEKLLLDVQDVAKKMGDGAGCSEFRAYDSGRRAVEAALESGDLGGAVKAWLGLSKLGRPTSRMKEEIDSLDGRLESEGERRIEEAKDKTELKRLAAEFSGHPFEKRIRKEIR